MILLCVFVAMVTVASGIHKEGSVTPPSRQPVPSPQIPQPPQQLPANTTTEFQNSSETLRRSESPQIKRMYIYKPFPIPRIRPPNVKYKVPATPSGTIPSNINSVAKKVIAERSRQYNQVPKPLVSVGGPLPANLAGPTHNNLDQSNVTSHDLRSTITSPAYPEPTLHSETKKTHYTKYELMQKQLMGMLNRILNPLKSMISRSHETSGQETANQRQLVKDARALSNLLAKLKQGDQSLLMRRLRMTPTSTNQHRQPDIRAQKQRQKRLAQQRQQRRAQHLQQRLARRRQQRLEEQRQRLAQQRQRQQQWHQKKQRQPLQGWQQQQQQWQQRQFWQRRRQRLQRQRQQNQRLHNRYQIPQKQPQQQYHQNQRQQHQHQLHQQHSIVSRSLTLDHEGSSKKYVQSNPLRVYDQLRSWILSYTEQRSRKLLRQIRGVNEPTSSIITRSNINQFSNMFGLDMMHNLPI